MDMAIDRYLFKAKRIDGEWVVGYYFCMKHNDERKHLHHFIIPLDIDLSKGRTIDQIQVEVDPSTICQCTGAHDKNGELIWENDILVGHLDDNFPEDTTYTMVVWHNNGFCTKEHGSEDVLALDEFDQEHFEVCGNWFDNPELLEVEHDTD